MSTKTKTNTKPKRKPSEREFKYNLENAGYFHALDKAKMNRKVAKSCFKSKRPKGKQEAFKFYTEKAIEYIQQARRAKQIVLQHLDRISQ